MPDEEPTQTTPEGDKREQLDLPGEGGYEIPVPKRRDVLAALEKVAEPRRGRPPSVGDGGSGPKE